jgi:hypothetical protein
MWGPPTAGLRTVIKRPETPHPSAFGRHLLPQGEKERLRRPFSKESNPMTRPRPPRAPASPPAPDDDDRPLHPAEERRLRRELASRIDHLWAIAERRRARWAAPPFIPDS